MNLSEKLHARVRELWDEAAEKAFLKKMAEGTLKEERFRYYMIQDYLYLHDYIEILKQTQQLSDSSSLTEYLGNVIEETKKEISRVHLPQLKRLGVRDEDLSGSEKASVLTEYVAYMRLQLEEEGALAGLTALLQCSWLYAFVGKRVSERYAGVIERSPYKSWFDAYTCPEYVHANQTLTRILDRESEGISEDKTETLCRIFESCAKYENRFWDVLNGEKKIKKVLAFYKYI